jgi:hypothetical protein
VTRGHGFRGGVRRRGCDTKRFRVVFPPLSATGDALRPCGATVSDGDSEPVAWKLLPEWTWLGMGWNRSQVDVAVGGAVVGLMRDVVAIGRPWEGGGAGNGRRRPLPMSLSDAR